MIKKKKISLFIPSLDGGGAEKVVITLANKFYIKGFQVDLIVIKTGGKYHQQLNSGINVVNLNCDRIVFCLFSLINYLKKNRPDILLSSLTHVNIISIISVLISRVKSRLIIIEHSLKTKLYRNLNFKNRLIDILMLITYPKAHSIVAVSNEVARNISTRSGISLSRIKTIYNPVFSPTILIKSKLNVPHPWFATNEPPVILSVGRLTEEKNFSLLIRAFAKVRSKQNLRLLILGEGKMRNKLNSLAFELGVEKDFDMPGFVQNPYAFMRRASLFVLSSNYEGFGNVLVEAMACGAPIISTNCPGGPVEILENGIWGNLIPTGDLNALTQGITKMLNKKDHPNCLERAKEFNIDIKIKEYINLMFKD